MPLGLSYPQPPQPGPSLPHYPGKMHGPFSQVLQPVRDMTSSPILMILGPALPPIIGGQGGGWGEGHLSLFTVYNRQGTFFCDHTPGTAHLKVPWPEIALLCFPGNVWGLLSQVLQ